jgi:ATP-binding cassette subfamily F protein uup
MLLGIVKPDSGHFDIGETVRFGYYSQEGLQFDENAKVIDIMQDIAEYVTLGNGDRLSVSQFLTYFLFSPDKQHDYVSKLSGGERRRLYLCTVLMHNPNFLILDEPTNDLDIITLNVLEEYLAGFHGCVIVVSHDRYFMDKVVDHLLVFHGQAEIQDFPGNYTQYREYREAKELLARREKENVEKPKESTPKQPIRNDSEGKRKLTFKERKEYEALEKEIDDLEKEKAELETLLNSGTLDPQALTDKSKRYAEVLQLIDDKSTRWLELSEFA